MDVISPQMEEAHEKLERQKVVPIRPGLRIVGGGNDLGDNWLFAMPVGSIFLSRPKTTDHSRAQLMMFLIEWKMDDEDGGFAVRIQSLLNESRDFMVDSVEFCKENDLYAWRKPNDIIPGERNRAHPIPEME